MTIIEGKCRLYKSGAHCAHCCSSPEWRAERGIEECPHGRTAENIPNRHTGGPGTELKRILAAMGIKPRNCNCKAMAGKMDRWGPQGCRDNMEQIVKSLTHEANQRGWLRVLPLKGLWAEMLINRAIEASEKLTP